jgi:glutamyl-Q tRNA(Asp) synthetase
VVRGADLLDSTPRQIFLQRCLGLPTPAYMHLPVALNEKGEKLSKQTGARPIAPSDKDGLLRLAFDFLGLPDSGKLTLATATEAWKRRVSRA